MSPHDDEPIGLEPGYTPQQFADELNAAGIPTTERSLKESRLRGGRSCWPYRRLPNGEIRYFMSDAMTHHQTFIGRAFTSTADEGSRKPTLLVDAGARRNGRTA